MKHIVRVINLATLLLLSTTSVAADHWLIDQYIDEGYQHPCKYKFTFVTRISEPPSDESFEKYRPALLAWIEKNFQIDRKLDHLVSNFVAVGERWGNDGHYFNTEQDVFKVYGVGVYNACQSVHITLRDGGDFGEMGK